MVSDFLKDLKENKIIKSTNHGSENKNGSTLAEVKNLVVSFPARKNIFGTVLTSYKAVDDVSFFIYQGETLGLVGESGCGKTTLGRALLRLVEPAHGSIIYNNTDITEYDKKKLKEFRKEV